MDIFAAAINRAFERSLRLLRPVRTDVWLKLFFLYILTGNFGLSSGVRFPFGGGSGAGTTAAPAVSTSTVAAPQTAVSTQPAAATTADDAKKEANKQKFKDDLQKIKTKAVDLWKNYRKLIISLAVTLAVLVF